MTGAPMHQADMMGSAAFVALLAWAGYVATTPEPSQLVTVGAAVHLLSLVMLLSQARRKNGLPAAPFAGVSLLAISLGLRLCSTTYFQGYLPIDSTGDGPYQILEGLTLLCCLRAVALFESKGGRDWRPVLLALVACSGAAAACYGDLDKNPTFDGIYAMSIYAEVCASIAIFLHSAELRAANENVPYGFIAPQLVGFACRGMFWQVALPEIAVSDPVRQQQYFPQVLFGAHVLICVLHGITMLKATAPVVEPVAAIGTPPGGMADLSTLMLGDLKLNVPQGCSQLVPLSAVYTTDGMLRVVYKPA